MGALKAEDDNKNGLTLLVDALFDSKAFSNLDAWRRRLALRVHILVAVLLPLIVLTELNHFAPSTHFYYYGLAAIFELWAIIPLLRWRQLQRSAMFSALGLLSALPFWVHAWTLNPSPQMLWMVAVVLLAAAFFGLRGVIILSIVNVTLLLAFEFGALSQQALSPAILHTEGLSKILFVLSRSLIIFAIAAEIAGLLRWVAHQLAETQKNHAMYRLLAENVSDVIWTEDLDFKLRYVSPSVLQQRGVTPEEAKNQPVEKRLSEKSRREVQLVLKKRLEMLQNKDPAAWKPLNLEIEQIHRDGHIVPTEITVRFIEVDGEDRPLILGVSRDISARKKAEEQAQKLELQLQQSQKMEAIGRLAGGVAHDFNNVLCAITGNVELAQDEDPVEEPEALQESLREISKAADRASALTQQLLAFSRRQVRKPELLDLGKLINNLRAMLTRLIGEDIHLRAETREGEFQVLADAGQLEQVLVNLVINARDAMPDGGELHIDSSHINFDEDFCESHPWSQPGAYIVLEVSDTGCGISKELQAHIFEPFFTTKAVGEGTGLGLATVYGIIAQNKGHIDLYSEPGQGTTFRIYLPAAAGEVHSSTSKSTDLAHARAHEGILLVEDEEMVRKVAVRIIKHLGYRVFAAASPEQALDLAKTHADEIDLLLTDVVMPNMNGKELADKMAELLPKIKILFTSGYTQNIIAQKGVLEQETQFIAKPYRREALASKLRELLDGSV